MRRGVRRLLSSVGRWGFTFMVVPRRGSIRRVTVPWLGVIGLIAAIGVSGYLCIDYVQTLSQTNRQLIKIKQLKDVTRKLEIENNQIKPALKETKRIQAELNHTQNELAGISGAFNSAPR